MPRARQKIRRKGIQVQKIHRKGIQRSKKGHRKKCAVQRPVLQEGTASFQSKRRLTDAGSFNATKQNKH
jgi:hypothetical protein